MTAYGNTVPAVSLGVNLVLRDMVLAAQDRSAQMRRGPRATDLHPRDAASVAPLLAKRIEASMDMMSALDCFEAATSEELYRQNEELYRGIALAALRRALLRRRVNRRSSTIPQLHTFVRLVCERAFWGRDGERFGRTVYCQRQLWQPDWHSSHERDLADMLWEVIESEGARTKDWQGAMEHFFGSSRASQGEQPVQRGRTDHIKLDEPFRLFHAWRVRINNRAELAFAVRGMSTLERDGLPHRRGDEIFDHGTTMFASGLRHCADQYAIPNAQAAYGRLFGTNPGRRQPTLEIMRLLALADSVMGPSALAPANVRLVLRVPWAMDVVGDTVAYRGHNELSEELRQNICTFFRLAGDLCALGEFLRNKHYAGKTVGEYLADHPRVDPEEFADRMNPQRVRSRGTDPQFRARQQQLGSVVYWNRTVPGYGHLR